MEHNWTEIEVGNVKMIHHSTASVIEIIITEADKKEEIWLDYIGFSNLTKAIKQLTNKEVL